MKKIKKQMKETFLNVKLPEFDEQIFSKKGTYAYMGTEKKEGKKKFIWLGSVCTAVFCLLILGGVYFNNHYVIQNTNIKFLTLLGKTGTRIAETLKQHSFNNFLICTTLEECVKNLYDKAKHDNNSVIILSPASASYDMYKNFEERGTDFKTIIEQLN